MTKYSELMQMVTSFRSKYFLTIGWRLSKNAKIIADHLHEDEVVEYAFFAQKNDNPLNIVGTAVIALTNKRLLIGRDRVVVGYFFDSITPDLFNDLKIKSGIIFGKIEIDTVKEFVVLSNIDKRALTEIEKKISSFMIKGKKQLRCDEENA